jgi:hypothetical protein
MAIKRVNKREESIQVAVCNYLKLAYPDVIFTCDLSSGMKLTIGQAVKAQKMRSSKGLPDIMILEPKGGELGYAGLMLELKSEKAGNKNGTVKQTDHTREQQAILDRLEKKGYMARFAIGFDEAQQIIDFYMNQ